MLTVSFKLTDASHNQMFHTLQLGEINSTSGSESYKTVRPNIGIDVQSTSEILKYSGSQAFVIKCRVCPFYKRLLDSK